MKQWSMHPIGAEGFSEDAPGATNRARRCMEDGPIGSQLLRHRTGHSAEGRE